MNKIQFWYGSTLRRFDSTKNPWSFGTIKRSKNLDYLPFNPVESAEVAAPEHLTCSSIDCVGEECYLYMGCY
ncbi:MAG: hypothetical protein RIC03_04515 [Cyclobacteriaceae bacterium]